MSEQNATVSAPKKSTELVVLREQIVDRGKEYSAALPRHIPSERFVRTVLTAIQVNPELITADRASLLNACMRAAQDGLLIDGREAALLVYNVKQKDGTYKKMASYIPMVAGIMKKARNSGAIASIAAHVVYERDTFAYVLGDDERIEHQPYMEGDRGHPQAVYAIVRLKDGGVQREVMSAAEVEAIRSRSRAAKSGPWVTDWSEMARKTVIRRIAKFVPSSSDKDDGSNLIDIASRGDEIYEMGAPAAEPEDAPKKRGRRPAAEILSQEPVETETTPPAIDGEREPGSDDDVV